MLKKLLFMFCIVGIAGVSNQAAASENELLARVHWNININAGFYPYFYNPYYCYPCPPPCAYPCPPPYWMW